MADDDSQDAARAEEELPVAPRIGFPRPGRRPLKIESLPSDDNLLEQLVESMKRIEDGLSGVRDLVVGIDARVKRLTGRLLGPGSHG